MDFDPTDPRSIRKLLMEIRYRGGRIDGSSKMSAVDATVRAVMTAADMQGMSGEDTMTLLAYHALLRAESAFDSLLDFHNLDTSRFLVIKEPK